jgi:hypothetical protein
MSGGGGRGMGNGQWSMVNKKLVYFHLKELVGKLVKRLDWLYFEKFLSDGTNLNMQLIFAYSAQTNKQKTMKQ